MTPRAKKKTAAAAPPQPAVAAPAARRRVPPPPGRDTMPPKPSFGWIGDPEDLTHGELAEIVRHAGVSLREMDMAMLLPYAAVAYARRENQQLYPWSVAGLLKMSEVDTGVIDTGPDEQQLADLQEAALERGEPMPDPA